SVARAHELVGEASELLRRHVGEPARRLIVVLVLEPRQALHAPDHGAELARALLPGPGEALLVRVLGSDLEEEPDALSRHGHLEVRMLLVAARVGAEGDPRVVGRVD